MPVWFAHMGPLGLPLGLCSLLALALMLERMGVFLTLPNLRHAAREAALSACLNCEHQACSRFEVGARRGWRQALGLLLRHSGLGAQQREELLGCWLVEERQRLGRHLRLLQLIGVLAPMLGLLGTVLGMLEMFAGIAQQNQPVTPALLADGLWQALYTTVWGLCIAIPALAAGQGFGLWAERYLESVQTLLNRCHLALDGLELTSDVPALRWSNA